MDASNKVSSISLLVTMSPGAKGVRPRSLVTFPTGPGGNAVNSAKVYTLARARPAVRLPVDAFALLSAGFFRHARPDGKSMCSACPCCRRTIPSRYLGIAECSGRRSAFASRPFANKYHARWTFFGADHSRPGRFRKDSRRSLLLGNATAISPQCRYRTPEQGLRMRGIGFTGR